MKASPNAAAPWKVPSTYPSPNPANKSEDFKTLGISTTMYKKAKKLAIAEGEKSIPYLIDNKRKAVPCVEIARKMRSTTMYYKRKALSGFMGKKSNACISLNPKELSRKSGGSEKNGMQFTTISQKIKPLSPKRQNVLWSYHNDNKQVILWPENRVTKKKGAIFPDRTRNVVENTCRKNVTFLPYHDIDENKLVVGLLPRCN